MSIRNGTTAKTSEKRERYFFHSRRPHHRRGRAAVPESWLKFLGELLYLEDIPTLQELMGYCLLPTTNLISILV